MSRKKPPEQKPGDFVNTPFKSLKGLPLRPSSQKEQAPKQPSSPAREEDAAGLFLRAVGDVKKRGAGPREKARPAAAAPPRREQEKDNELFLQAMKQMGPVFLSGTGEAEESAAGRISVSGRMKQLKRGTIRISEELDLHGYFKDEALAKLQNFIAGAYARGRQAVLVITGKGINSPEGPVLPGAVSKWLGETGKGMVAEFAPAPRDRGGSGAFVVFLKSRRS